MDASGEEDVSTDLPSAASSTSFLGVFVSTFTMNFLAEWGDKSQLSVIILAARSSFALVCAGALAGHFVANSLAVIGGSFIRDIISIRTGNDDLDLKAHLTSMSVGSDAGRWDHVPLVCRPFPVLVIQGIINLQLTWLIKWHGSHQ